jgi:hypothetical protein
VLSKIFSFTPPICKRDIYPILQGQASFEYDPAADTGLAVRKLWKSAAAELKKQIPTSHGAARN